MATPLGHCADLKAIFRRQAGAWLDRDTLQRVQQLCRSAAEAAEDAYCAAELGRVSHYARQLHSHRDPRTDALREQILLALESIEHRL
jgi:phosphoglycerate-specific signal transduction histidine kinase